MFKVFWDYQEKKDGSVVIQKEELQRMVNAAYDSGYKDGKMESDSEGSKSEE